MFRALALRGAPNVILSSVPLEAQLEPWSFRAACYSALWTAMHAQRIPCAPITFDFKGTTYYICVPTVEELRLMQFFKGMAAA